MLALPEGHADAARRFIDRCRVTGPWPAVEREAAEALVRLAVGLDNLTFWPTDQDDELFIGLPWTGQSWARVRVSVEVLDGIL